MINRLAEQKILQNLIDNAEGTSTIMIIYSKTGVGKSYLSDHVFSKAQDLHYIRVKVNKRQAEEDDSIFFASLAQTVDNYAQLTTLFPTIEEYIKVNHKIDNQRIVNDVLDIIADLTKAKLAKTKVDNFVKHKADIVKNILRNDVDVSETFLIDYLCTVARNKRTFISIENIHLSSPKFIKFLLRLLTKEINLTIIGEFTISETEDEVIEFIDHFGTSHFKPMELHKLGKGEIIGSLMRITDSDMMERVVKIIQSSYDDSDGNLRKLQWLIKKNTSKWKLTESELGNINYDNILHFIYKNLKSNSKLYLWYIIVHSGYVNLELFMDLLDFKGHTTDQAMEDLVYLQELELVKIERNVLNLVHDSMFELLKEEQDHVKYRVISNSDWLTFYQRITTEKLYKKYKALGIFRQDVLVIQLTFILSIGGSNNVDWLNNILSEINKSLIGAGNSTLIKKIIKIFDTILDRESQSEILDRTYEWVILILYKLGYSSEICRMMKRYTPSNPSEILFLTQFSAQISVCDTSVLSDLEYGAERGNEYLKTGCLLLLTRYHRTFNNSRMANQIWRNELLKTKNSVYQYNIFEYANICTFNINKRIKYLRKAEIGFKDTNNLYQLCSTHLSIISNYFYLYFWGFISKRKFLKTAHERLDNARELLSVSHFPIHIYLNQKNVVNLVGGEVDRTIVLENFKIAYDNCGITGNKILIGSNIVATSLAQKEYSGVQSHVDELVNTSRSYAKMNSEFARYPLLNCYRYYKDIGPKSKWKETIELFVQGNALGNNWNYFLEHPFFLMMLFSRIKFYPTNIVNWDIDFQHIKEAQH
jgi:hypothetical protein